MHPLKKMAAGLAALAMALTGAIFVGSAAQAVPNSIPLTITNNSGNNQPVYIYVLGHPMPNQGRDGSFNAQGNFTPWPTTGVIPQPTPDVAIAGPANGQSMTITLPRSSGRVYFSYGEKLQFSYVNDGRLVQPSLATSTDPNWQTDYNWSEYTFNQDGIWINSTQVDMFASPYQVGSRNSAGQTISTGRLKDNGFNAVVNAVRNTPGYANTVINKPGSNEVLRVLAPSHAIGHGLYSTTGLDNYIDRAWNKYRTTTATFVPWLHEPNRKFYGNVSGNVMTVRDGNGAFVASFNKPTTDAVLGCHKELQAVNDTQGVIARTICSDLNRSVFLQDGNHPHTNASNYYQDSVTNHYSKIIHQNMVDGRAYGFAFDDVVEQESLVHDPDTVHAYMNLDPRTGSAPLVPGVGGDNGGGDNGGGDNGGGDNGGGSPVGDIDSSLWYRVKNQTSNKCIDAKDWGSHNGAHIHQWDCNPSFQWNQDWQFEHVGNGYYVVKQRHGDHRIWDILGGDSMQNNGAQAGIWDRVGNQGSTNQRWQPVKNSDGTFTFKAQHSNKCLDISNSSTQNGAKVQQWNCNGTGAQKFSLYQAP